MYILILGYSECGEWLYEVEHCDDVLEVESVLETVSKGESGTRMPDSVELARTINDAPTDNILRLMGVINQ